MDDGISGEEFAARPGFLRLMNALRPRPAFQVLVMSEELRLGREAIETAYSLKQIVRAGVRELGCAVLIRLANELFDHRVYLVQLHLYLTHPREMQRQFFSDSGKLVFYHRHNISAA